MWFSTPASLIATLATAAGLYGLLLEHPEPCFAYSVSLGPMRLSSDHPFRPEAGREVLAKAREKLEAFPYFDAGDPLRAFVCNDGWRYRLFFNRSAGAAGVCITPFPAVFLRRADVDHDRMLALDGSPVAPPRDLAYYVAHEMTHAVCGERLGMVREYALPRWVREGLADYVARRGTFSLPELRAAYHAHAPEMDPARSGRYDRFMLMVAVCLDERHLSIDQLLGSPPAEREVEETL